MQSYYGIFAAMKMWIRFSASYRIGRFITWIPRKVRGFFRCYREHGWRYTCKRVLVHLHLK